jgi:hypothetical protein
MIHKPEKVKNYIMLRNITHFGQAYGSPFTTPPLDQIKWSADDNISESLLNGNVPEAIHSDNPYTNGVLQAIAKAKSLPEIDTYIPSKDVAKGFK